MTELKTLDDFPQSWRRPNCEAHEKPKCVQVHDLRAEAIKRAKQFRAAAVCRVPCLSCDEFMLGKVAELMDFF